MVKSSQLKPAEKSLNPKKVKSTLITANLALLKLAESCLNLTRVKLSLLSIVESCLNLAKARGITLILQHKKCFSLCHLIFH